MKPKIVRKVLAAKHQPPLTIGDWCQLNSGGAEMLVVDFNDDTVTVSWRPWVDKWRQSRFPTEAVVSRALVQRIPPPLQGS